MTRTLHAKVVRDTCTKSCFPETNEEQETALLMAVLEPSLDLYAGQDAIAGCSMPYYARVKAGYAIRPIGVAPRDVQLPNDFRIIRLRNLNHAGTFREPIRRR